MYNKVVSILERYPHLDKDRIEAENEIYEGIKNRNNIEISSDDFTHRMGEKSFTLVWVCPISDRNVPSRLWPAQKEVIKNLLAIQKKIKKDLGDAGHFYQTEKDLHMTFFTHTDIKASDLADLSEAKRNEYRASARTLTWRLNKENYTLRDVYFYGGLATQNSVIISGYNFAELEKSRDILKTGYPIANTPNIAHISLIQFREHVPLAVREKINEKLNNIDFGKAVFPTLGLYEFNSFGVFSEGRPHPRVLYWPFIAE